MPWQLGTKFQRKVPLFSKIPEFKKNCRTSWGKSECQKNQLNMCNHSDTIQPVTDIQTYIAEWISPPPPIKKDNLLDSASPLVTIHPRFSGTVPTCPGKNHSSSRTPICPFLDWCPGFVPHSYFWHVSLPIYSCMLMHRWPKISSDFICIYEKIAGSQGSALDPAGELMTFPRPKSNPDDLRLRCTPYD